MAMRFPAAVGMLFAQFNETGVNRLSRFQSLLDQAILPVDASDWNVWPTFGNSLLEIT
jgi:hypothetical protein